MKHIDQQSTIATTIISLEKAFLDCSGLKVIFEDLCTYPPYKSVDAKWAGTRCVLTGSGFFDSLLPREWHGKKVLTIILPKELSAILNEGVEQEPFFFNQTSTDLQINRTYAAWELGSGTRSVSVVVCDSALLTLINGRYEEIVPVMMVAGDTVVVGGFLVSDIFRGNFQAAGSSSGQNWRPVRVYSDNELELAAIKAKRIGNFPWRESVHRWDSGFQFFEPQVLDYRDL